MKSDAIAELAHAKQSNDIVKVTAATDKLTNIMEAEYIAETMYGKAETSEKAIARLQSKAVELEGLPDSPEKRKMLETIDKEIKTRGAIARKYKDASGVGEGEKERQIGLASLVANTRRTILEQYIPSENLYSLPDGNVGIRSLDKPELAQKAFIAVQEKLIEMLTKNGVPVDNSNRLMLLANGVNFDENGRAVVNRDLTPAFRPLGGGTPAPAMPSQPSAAPTPSKTLPMPPVAAPPAPPAATPAPAGGPVTVKLPDGKTATFPNTQAAEEFKKKAGIK